MIRGLSFRVRNQWDCYLYKIFENIDLLKYNWYIAEDEIVCDNRKSLYPVFREKEMDGGEFLRSIRRIPYYLIFADIRAYHPFRKQNIHEKITTYSEFVKSDCEFILLCTDSTFFELYSKNAHVIDQVRDACRKNKFKEVSVITDENDYRKSFSVKSN